MPKSTSTSTRLETPQPVSPVAGRPTEGSAPTFSWLPVPNATSYHLQIAHEADFEDLYFDAPVEDATELTVYDALPEDGSTCYWRVRAESGGETGRWSGVAHFTADPDADAAQAVTAQRDESAAPSPSHPVDGAPVDGHAATFEWEPGAAASGYQIQVAPTRDFDAPAVDLTLDRTTSLTLYGMLPEDGSAFFWRVRALLPGQRTSAWSRAAEGTAATDEDVISYQAEQEIREQEALAQQESRDRATAAERAEAESPVRTARTPGWAAITLGYVAVLSFLATLFLIAQAV